MNFLDLIILLPIVYFAYQGFRNGFIREFFGIVGIVLAVYITFEHMETISVFLAPLVEDRDRSTIITGIITFIIIVILVQLIGVIFEKVIDVILLGMLNKIGGLIFAALKAAILISTTLLLLAGLGIPSAETTSNSASYPIIIYVAPTTFDIVAKVIPGTENFINTIEQSVRENNAIKNVPIFENLDS